MNNTIITYMIADVFIYHVLPFLKKSDKIKLFKSGYLSELYSEIMKISFSGMSFTKEMSFLSMFTKLTFLDLSCCNSLTESTFVQLTHLPLIKLNLYHTHFTDQMIKFIPKNVREIDLSRTLITDQGILLLSQLNNNITNLKIYFCPGLTRYVMNYIPFFHQLEHLDISGNFTL